MYIGFCALLGHMHRIHCLKLVKVRRRLDVSLIMPHIRYGGIVYAGAADAASQRRLNMAFRACLRRLYHVFY
jgi:hypothetical protein